MNTKSLCVLGVLGILTAVVEVSSAPLPQNNARTSRPRYHDVNRLIAQSKDGTSTSGNWSGYAVTGTNFTKVAGSWIVPGATCTSGNQFASFWVGIDGYNSNTVEQLGTESDCSGSQPSYHAWSEFCCREPEIPIQNFAVKPGDVMAAAVSYDGSQFKLSLKNMTTGKTFTRNGNIRGAQRTSAEWIAEAPSSGGILPLTNFGTMLFGKDHTNIARTCFAANGSIAGPISAFTDFFQITMVNGSSNPKAIPSILSSDGTSFSDTWVASQ